MKNEKPKENKLLYPECSDCFYATHGIKSDIELINFIKRQYELNNSFIILFSAEMILKQFNQ